MKSSWTIVLVPLFLGLLALAAVYPAIQAFTSEQRIVQESRLEQETSLLASLLVGDPRFQAALEKKEDQFRYEAVSVTGPVDLDGKDDDWPDGPVMQLSIEHLLEIYFPYATDSLQARLRVGTSADSVYLYYEVTDDLVVYRDLGSLSVHRNDYIQIAGVDGAGRFRKFTVAAYQPSGVRAQEVSVDNGRALREVPDIEGRWLATGKGYNLELRLPMTLVEQGFSTVTVDVDDESERNIRFVMGFSHTRDMASLGEILAAVTPLQKLIETMPGGVEVKDASGEVLASNLHPGDAGLVVTADMVAGGRILGSLTMRRVYHEPDIRVLLLPPLIVLAGVALGLGWAAFVLRRIARQDLQKAQVLERTTQYNHYLERMAARLNHELRTPVTVIKSSLEHLEAGSSDSVYVDRALEGVTRLNRILYKMAEARRLEEALDEEEVVRFDLALLVKGCVAGYETAYPEQPFELSLEAQAVPVTGIPDLIAQLFDKLIDNAVSFSSGEPVRVRLNTEGSEVCLRVMNSGQMLPETDTDTLFESMVRLRGESDSADHLGLGLYIARTIADFHGGDISIGNREDTSGVIVTLRLPILRITSKLK